MKIKYISLKLVRNFDKEIHSIYKGTARYHVSYSKCHEMCHGVVYCILNEHYEDLVATATKLSTK